VIGEAPHPKDRKLKILQVSSADEWGGAEVTALRLFETYRALGHDSWLAVGTKRGSDPDVFSIPNDECRSSWTKRCKALNVRFQKWKKSGLPVQSIRNLLTRAGEPNRWLEQRLGYEDFYFPGTWKLLDLPPQPPDIIHCHNLHGGYFDLRALPQLSRQVPLILNARDAWLLSGHCAHSFNCQRWTNGCGQCPDLTIYPSIRRDATERNWKRKHQLLSSSRYYLTTPSQWLMDKVKQSPILASAIECRVIPNSVDQFLFKPVDKQAIRAKLGISPQAKVLVFVANALRDNEFKDFSTIEAAIQRVVERGQDKDLLLLALGDQGDQKQIGRATIQFVPFQNERSRIASYYQAADLYVHAARADTFPNTVLEALACGTPVVATAVGGIPEQVKGLFLQDCGSSLRQYNHFGPNAGTGILTPPADSEAMSFAIERLLTSPELRRRLRYNAVADAIARFSPSRQVNNFLSWYEEILERTDSSTHAHREFMHPDYELHH
jgi:glycosyltransferase involved in cell wall biosynthesis